MATLAVRTSNGGRDGSAEVINANWTTCRNTASQAISQPESVLNVEAQLAASNYRICRSFLTFDTRALDGGIVTAATLALVPDPSYLHADNVALQTHATTTPLAYAATDWATANFGSECATRLAFSTSGAKTYTLNATGLAWIKTGGYTVFGLRKAADVDNVTPTSEIGTKPRIYGSQNATESNRPLLTITYTPVAKGNIFLFGGGVTIA
jgi:hypothetical protein